ncbi:MAG: lipopolysaccharide biosynthesis protein [Angustibacter sp.]
MAEPSASPSASASASWRALDLNAPIDGQVTSRFALSTAGMVSQGGVRFLYSVLIGGVMSSAVLGTVNSALSLSMFAAMLWPTSTGVAASKYVALSRGAGDREQVLAVAAHLARRVLVSSLLLAVASVVTARTALEATWSTSAFCGALVFTYSAYTFVRGLAFGAGQVRRATTWDVVSSSLALGGLVLVLVLRAQPWLLAPITAGYGLYALAGWPRTRGAGPRGELRREMDQFVFFGVVGVLASAGLLQLSMVVAKLATGAHDAGQYAAALSLATPSSMLANAMTLVLFPALSAAYGRGDSHVVHRMTDLATRGLVAGMVAVFGALILLSDVVVAVIYPHGFGAAAHVLPVLLAAVLTTTLGVASTTSLLVTRVDGQKIIAALNVVGFVVGCAAWAVLLPSHASIERVALGYCVAAVVIGVAPLVIVWRTEGQPWRGLSVRALSGGLLVAAAVGVEHAVGAGTVGRLLVTVAFEALWLALAHRDLLRLVTEVRQRR